MVRGRGANSLRGWNAGALTLAVGIAAFAGEARAEDPLASVIRAVRAEDEGAALSAWESLPEDVRRSPRARFLRARILEEAGRYAEAAHAYGFDAKGLPAGMETVVARRLALAQSRSGECAAARPVLLAWAATKDPRSEVAQAVAAECAFADANVNVAVDELAAVVGKDARDVDGLATRLALSAAFERAGRHADAVRTLKDAFINRAEHPDVGAVAERLAAMAEPLVLTEEEHLARAQRLATMKEHTATLIELAALGMPKNKALWAQYYHLRGMALYSLRQRYEDAAKDLQQAVRLKATTAPDDLFTAARALSRADKNRAAMAVYRKFVRLYPGHPSTQEAEYLTGWLALREGDASGATALEKLVTKYAKKGGDFAGEALFRVGFEALERKKPKKAAPLFEKFAALSGDTMVRARGLYWLGVAKIALHDKAGAVTAFRAAMAVEPLHWYSLLAAQRIASLGEDPGRPFPEAAAEVAAPAAIPADLLPPDVAFLRDLGFDADADERLVAQESAVRARGGASRGTEFAVRAYDAIGDHPRASRMAQNGFSALLKQEPTPATEWAWRAAYPAPFAADVSVASQRHGVPAAYLYAIMRQESSYDRVAVSYADAIGLLQLLPTTAARVGKGLGVEVTRDMLFEPRWNIEVSAAYSENLLKRMHGVEPLAIASYNAGEERVERWLRETGKVDLDRFVERIPVDQTRNYVRRVTSHYAHYLYLAHPERGWPLTLPEQVGPMPKAAAR